MSTASPDSRWWYLVLAVPLYYVLATALSFVVGFAAFVAALTGAGAAGGPGPGAEIAVGFGVVSVVVVAFLLFFLGVVLSFAFPVAIYFDAEAVTDAVTDPQVDAGSEADATATVDADADWRPDPALYGLLGLAGVVAQPLQVPLAVYYLYKRHEATGVP